jgi:hypothetical protein
MLIILASSFHVPLWSGVSSETNSSIVCVFYLENTCYLSFPCNFDMQCQFYYLLILKTIEFNYICIVEVFVLCLIHSYR